MLFFPFLKDLVLYLCVLLPVYMYICIWLPLEASRGCGFPGAVVRSPDVGPGHQTPVLQKNNS